MMLFIVAWDGAKCFLLPKGAYHKIIKKHWVKDSAYLICIKRTAYIMHESIKSVRLSIFLLFKMPSFVMDQPEFRLY